MPRGGGDGTDSMGMGAKTGRAAGFCAGTGTPGYVDRGGRGMGLGVVAEPPETLAAQYLAGALQTDVNACDH